MNKIKKKNKKPLFIAEIGINHNGSINLAKKLILEAKRAGCDFVKFQKRTIEIVYSKDFLQQARSSPWGKTQLDQKKKLEFSGKEYDIIDEYCKKINIKWFASAWDVESFNFLKKYKLEYNKIASPMLTNLKFIEIVAKNKKHTFISTGMSKFKDIKKAIQIFKKNKCKFTLMHCVSEYPCDDKNLNLNNIIFLKKTFKCDVGYSGHESTLSPSVVAASLGATVIERHITLDRSLYGSDQAASLSIDGLKKLLNILRKLPLMLGGKKDFLTLKEKAASKKLRYF